jgi:hypothetical protein
MTINLVGKPRLLVKSEEGFTLRVEWDQGSLIVAGISDQGFTLAGNELAAFVDEIRQYINEVEEHSCDQDDCPCFEEGEDQGRERGEEGICNRLEEALDNEDVDLVQFVTNLVGR